MSLTGSYAATLQLSKDVVEQALRANLLCSVGQTIPCQFVGSFSVCGAEVAVTLNLADTDFGCVIPTGRATSTTFVAGVFGGGGVIRVDTPAKVSFQISGGSVTSYDCTLTLPLAPTVYEDKVVVPYYSIDRDAIQLSLSNIPADVIAAVTPNCIRSFQNAGQLQPSYFAWAGSVGVVVALPIDGPLPTVLGLDEIGQTITVGFPVSADFDFTANPGPCAGRHLVVSGTLALRMPYSLSQSEYCLEPKLATVEAFTPDATSLPVMQQVLTCFGYSDLTEQSMKVAFSLLFPSIATYLPAELCQAIPAVSDIFAEQIADVWQQQEDIVVYNFDGSSSASSIAGRVKIDCLEIGLNGPVPMSGATEGLLRPNEGFAFAVPASAVHAELDAHASTEINNFNSSSARFVDGDEIRLRSMTIRLGTDKFQVDGSVKVIINNWPDKEADFEVDVLVLGIDSSGQLILSIGSPDVSVSCDALDVFLSVLTGGIYAVVNAAVSAALSNGIASSVTGSTSGAVFGSNLTLDLQDSIGGSLVHGFQRVKARSDGMIYGGFAMFVAACAAAAMHRRYTIDAVRKDNEDDIVGVRLRETGWKLTTEDAIALLEEGAIAIDRVHIVTRRNSGRKYLRSNRNTRTVDNLDNLPLFTLT